MMRNILKNKTLHVLLVSLIVTFLSFPELFLNPKEFFLGCCCDGLKNYYTFIYYVLFDEGYHFSGMNYPYGEHVLYTDNQFALSYLISKVNFLFTTPKSIFIIINIFTISSIPLGIIFIYLIFRKYELSHVLSLLFSIFIVFSSPQINRFSAHYSLFYIYVIPACWYFLLIIFQEEKHFYKSLIGLLFLGIGFSFIHLYYLLILAVLLFFSVLLFYIYGKLTLKKTGILLLIPITMAIVILLFRKYTDTTFDRVIPWGADFYNANISHLFFPSQKAINVVLRPFISYHEHSEGNNYLGVMIIISLISFLINLKLKVVTKNIIDVKIILWIGLLSYLVAIGLHNDLFGSFINNYIPQVAQFRSLSRVGWITYYLWCIGLSVFLYRLLIYIKNRYNDRVFYVIFILIIGVWGGESYNKVKNKIHFFNYTIDNNYRCDIVNDAEELNDFLARNINNEKYQSLLMLPYFSVGSEKFKMDSYFDEPFTYGVKTSLENKIPMMNGYLSRSSISQKMKQFQLFSHPLIKKEIVNDLSEKPIAVIVTNVSKLNDREREFLRKCNYVDSLNTIKIYDIWPSQINTLVEKIEVDSVDYIYKDFSDVDEKKEFLSCDIQWKDEKISNVIFENEIPNLDVNKEWEMSLWLKIDTKIYGMPMVNIQEKWKGEIISESTFSTAENCFDFYKGWLRVEYPIRKTKQNTTFKITLDGYNLAYDELLIRPRDKNILIRNKKEGINTFNNYPIDKSSFF